MNAIWITVDSFRQDHIHCYRPEGSYAWPSQCRAWVTRMEGTSRVTLTPARSMGGGGVHGTHDAT